MRGVAFAEVAALPSWPATRVGTTYNATAIPAASTTKPKKRRFILNSSPSGGARLLVRRDDVFRIAGDVNEMAVRVGNSQEISKVLGRVVSLVHVEGDHLAGHLLGKDGFLGDAGIAPPVRGERFDLPRRDLPVAVFH